MLNIYKLIIYCISLFILISCSEKISYSGKLLNEDAINYNSFNTKQDIMNELGIPSYIDPIEKKYYYFNEKFISKNFYNNKLDNRKLIVFNFNVDDSINSINEYDLSDHKKTKIIKDSIKNNLLEAGLLESIFGGVGKSVPMTNQ